MSKRLCSATIFIVLILAIMLTGLMPATAQDSERISRFGEYQGYSEALYSDYVRLSRYVEVRDGTRLAVDIFRPSENGVPVEDPLPVVWTHHRYHRASLSGGGVSDLIDQVPELTRLLYHGYVLAVVDVRGGGASFGMREGEFSRAESYDAYDITEWLAAQPWSTGKVGMFGISYLGITQYLAASTTPPHLVAIFPQMAMFDLYTFVYPGGVYKESFVLNWGRRTLLLDQVIEPPPVDDDPDGVLLAEARAQHAANWNIYTLSEVRPTRDAQVDGQMMYQDISPSSFVDAINASGVAIYHLGGWYDMYPADALTWFNNLTVPQRIVMTPWSHDGTGGFDLLAEHLRWFDYWLKDIDNGIMDEPPIVYDVMNKVNQYDWRSADEWPLPETVNTAFYFAVGPSGSVTSHNDGLLTLQSPASDTTGDVDTYTVDYTTTVGTHTRWANGRGISFGYPNMLPNDEKSLTYTTPPLENDLQITGHPVAHLWISSTADDGDFFAYLEEVSPDGYSRYITEGVLRASHRAQTPAPWNTFGLPFHRSFAEDLQPLPSDGSPVELVFDMQPTSNIFDAGNRLRITVTGADADTFRTPELDPPPTVTLYRSATYPSHVILPVIPAE